MSIMEYTPARAEALSKMNIPEIEFPIQLKILWFDVIHSNDRLHTIYTGTHSHSFIEIHFVFASEVSYEIHGNTITLSQGQALLIPPHTPHRYTGCSHNFSKTSLAFSLEKSETSFALSTFVKYTTFPFMDNVQENVDFILRQSEQNDFFSPTLIGNRILEILYSVCHALHLSLPGNPTNTTDARLSVAKRYIKENRNRLITCEDVAQECCLSRKQLNRIFKKDSDVTLHDYIIGTRIKYAKELLLQNKNSIKEISFLLGFENESSFISFFKRHCGMPPGTYRTEHLLENPITSPKNVNACPE